MPTAGGDSATTTRPRRHRPAITTVPRRITRRRWCISITATATTGTGTMATTGTIARGLASSLASNAVAVDYNRGMTLSISPVDLAIVIAYLVGTVLFGMWIGRG